MVDAHPIVAAREGDDAASDGDGVRPVASSAVGPVVWLIHIALPLLALWLVIAEPEADVMWEHHAAHFWLVLGIAVANLGIAVAIAEAAGRRSDARLLLVSLAFVSGAGFLALHALATPNVIVDISSFGFNAASSVGLLIAGLLAALSALDLRPQRAAALARHRRPLLVLLLAVIVAWAVASVLELPPLDEARPVEELRGELGVMGAIAITAYVFAAARYYLMFRRRPAVMLIGVITAFALLAEASLAMALARNWHASWWEWHLLMAAGFGFVSYSAYVQYRREGSGAGLFNSIATERTIRRIRAEYGAALEALVEAMRRRAETGERGGTARHSVELGRRFGLTEGQAEVLERSAEALAAEREQVLRLGALAQLGTDARVLLGEEELLQRALARTAETWQPDGVSIALLHDDEIVFAPGLSAGRTAWLDEPERARLSAAALESLEPRATAEDGARSALALPLTVKDRPAGVVVIQRSGARFADREWALAATLGAQLSISLENARLYREIDVLFRQYMSEQVVTAVLANPQQAALGGAVVEVTVLFADLTGFTPFTERSTPEQVVQLLNDYFGAAIPLIVRDGGTVNQFIGDAVMALFNVPARQADHALRAVRAAVAMQEAVDRLAARAEGLPRFRVGVNTGQTVVGNVGSEDRRTYTAIGDAVNLAARLEGQAPPGRVVIGPRTLALAGDAVSVTPLGAIEVKGKSRPVEAFIVEAVA